MFPVLHQVVGGNIRAVAGADKSAQSDVQRTRIVQDHFAHRAALGQEGNITGQIIGRGERGVHTDRRVGIQHTHTVRSDDAHTMAEGNFPQFSFAGCAFRSGFFKTIGDNDQTFYAFLTAFFRYF